ncbi:MAG: nucleoside triphosphate pyrophosphohydrolase [Akkermansia sp.]
MRELSEDEMLHAREPELQMARAAALMRRLRQPDGCPWDRAQTHDSIISNLVEECYETIDAIRSRDWLHLREELGDVLLQVLFHAQMAAETPEEGFDIDDVARELADKLVRRHPHVFGDAAAGNAAEVLSVWDAVKRREHAIEDKPYLHDVGKGLPALLRAFKLTKKVAKVGFDWPDHAGVLDKIREETGEVEETLPLPDADPRVAEELGDLLFTVVNLCRRRRVDPELALDAANRKFERRFNALERLLQKQGCRLEQATPEQLESAWQSVKTAEHRA